MRATWRDGMEAKRPSISPRMDESTTTCTIAILLLITHTSLFYFY